MLERGFDGGLDTSKKVYPGGIAEKRDGESDDSCQVSVRSKKKYSTYKRTIYNSGNKIARLKHKYRQRFFQIKNI